MSYDALANLGVTVEAVEFDRRERETSSGFTRATTTVSLSGAGRTGRGEDVTYDLEEHDPERVAAVETPPPGEYTIETFSEALASCSLFPSPPDREDFQHYRRWAFESAALDLALEQADTTLGARLDRTYDPVRFLVSTRLSGVDSDQPPSAGRVHRWLEIDPDVEFKLDPTPDWDGDLVADLAATGAVRTLDLKGHYEGTEIDTAPDPALYERILAAFPEALIEDPALTEKTRSVLAGHEHRVSWDAPITGIASIEALPFEPSWLNIKPSRFGSVQSLLETVEYCEDRDIALYGGGQFELGVGRRQIQRLASLFYPDGPNDVAPRAYNDPEPRAGLPASPLDPPVPDSGF